MKLSEVRIRTRFIVLLAGVLAVSLLMNVVWIYLNQVKQAEREMQEKAYVLSQQMDAVWEFMVINQDVINYDANGEYNFKRLHCSIVGKSIGKLFGKKTGYTIRYTNFEPRNEADVPDEFELKALNLFAEDPNVAEFYEISEFEGKRSFRYAAPMRIEENCLECHGEPAGELDILGYPKEGWKPGDLGGTMSIVMPIDIYTGNINSNVTKQVIYIFLVTFIIVLVIFYAMSKLVTKPLTQLKKVMNQVRTGDLDISLKNIDAQGEIKDLSDHFEIMTAELRNLYNDLEKKVQLRTQDLARAKDILETQRIQLEEANRRLREDNQYKSDFLAIVSHELRTPLTSIIAFAEVLERGKNSKDEKEQKMIQEIKSNSMVLLSMINNILDMARIEAGRKELILEPIDLVDVINAVESVVQPLVEKKEINFSTKVQYDVPLIEGDRDSIRSIVENLISNAIKFTPKGGKIKVWVVYDSQKKEVLITVQDNGIGIKKKDQPYIFEKFVQSDSSIQRQFGGSGLGLALTKELTELHGGWIKVSSEYGKGSIFTVGLPAAEEEDFLQIDF